MRLLNSVLAAIAMALALAHAIVGCLVLLEVVYTPIAKTLAAALVAVVLVHIVLSVALTVTSAKGAKPLAYAKDNASLWVRRATGAGIVLAVLFHIGSFGKVVDGIFVLTPWNGGTLAAAWALAICLTVHLAVTIKPLSVSLGVSFSQSFVRVAQAFVVLAGIAFLVSFTSYAMGWL